jgi:prepilin-type processing-associated H-X9-DG protein
MIYCPSVVYWGSLYPRAQELNLCVAGGPNWGTAAPWGVYGINVVPPPCLPMPDDFIPSGQWTYYGLGPPIEVFTKPNYQFLVIETEAGWEYTQGTWPYTKIILNDPAYPTYPAYTGFGGNYAFRHVLPNDKRLYQGQATANFLYLDGHVNTMTANEKINLQNRFDFTAP